VAGLPPEHCALRLEIACKAGTIQHLMSLFKDQDPDVYLLPITLRDGRACYQVLYGNFPNLKAAQKAIGRLPKALHAERDEPKVFRIADLANMQ
jgi:septal ring-binding cell division protein DamX